MRCDDKHSHHRETAGELIRSILEDFLMAV